MAETNASAPQHLPGCGKAADNKAIGGVPARGGPQIQRYYRAGGKKTRKLHSRDAAYRIFAKQHFPFRARQFAPIRRNLIVAARAPVALPAPAMRRLSVSSARAQAKAVTRWPNDVSKVGVAAGALRRRGRATYRNHHPVSRK